MSRFYPNIKQEPIYSDSFASFDTAFDPSSHLSTFQQKIMAQNPILSETINETINHNNNNDNHDNYDKMQSLSPQSEERINKNVDAMFQALYNAEKSENQYDLSKKIDLINSAQQYQSNNTLIEPFSSNIIGKQPTQLGFIKLLVIIIIISAIIYGVLRLLKNNNHSLMTTNTIESPPSYLPATNTLI